MKVLGVHRKDSFALEGFLEEVASGLGPRKMGRKV